MIVDPQITVSIKFETQEKAQAFIDWMDNAGEQHYWQHCEDAEVPMANSFQYFDSSLTIVENP